MRPDTAKVLCQRQRGGDRPYMGGNKGYEKSYRFRGEDRSEYGDLDSLPQYESMTRRLGYSQRSFGENLGALEGWVRSLVGKPWDKAYSELCRLCPPTGNNVQRHAHQHLDWYIERSTVVMEDGSVGFNSKYTHRWNSAALYRPIAESSADYYVHPKTKIVCRNKRKQQKVISWREAERKRIEGCLRIFPKQVFAKFNGLWYCYDIEAPETATRRHWDPITTSLKTYVVEINPDQLRKAFWDAYSESYGRMQLNYQGNARNKRQLNSRELRAHKLANDQVAA